MRLPPMLLAAFLATSTALGAEMSKDQCAPMVEGTKAIADQLKRMDVAFAKLEMKKNSELTSGEIFESAQRVEKARQQVLASMKNYEAAAEDLTQRLHSCAGVARDTGRAETPTDGKKLAPLFPSRPATAQ